MNFSNTFSFLFSISIAVILTVFLVLFFVFFIGKLLILLFNHLNIDINNDKEDITKTINSKINDITKGKGRVIKITKIDS